MLQVTNEEFLSVLFGADAPWCHVTDFTYDPGAIPKERHLAAWAGDYFSRYRFTPNSNQYFTISCFYADEQGKARRRKTLFRYTPVIVLDDVREKLSMDQVSKLPAPTWILETSPGSEQWGYLLDTPCADRHRVENLLDGLVANGLAPDGKDPGMKGVTRYVRLPGGVNNKAAKLVNGQPFKCRMLTWQPFNRVTMEDLAAPFHVDLDAVRREGRLDGAAAISDHPLINLPDVIHIKEVRSDGRFDVTCPWVDEHTGADDSGAGVFTNSDGTIGFKCHHGACQARTGNHLLNYVESKAPGFKASLSNWQLMRSFSQVAVPDFMGQPVATETPAAPQTFDFMGVAPAAPQTDPVEGVQSVLDQLRRMHPSSTEARATAQTLLKHVDSIPKIDQLHWHDQICDIMSWSKSSLKDILKDLREQWYQAGARDAEFYDRVVYVKELNQFYDWESRIFFSVEAFQNSYSHEDAEARKVALQDGRVKKVDRLDYAPRMPRIFTEGRTVYGNTYTEDLSATGTAGDVGRWLEHFDVLGWGQHRKHILQWMAFTILHPDRKINHMLLLGSGEGCGKDFILFPLIEAMGENCSVISGEDLIDDYSEYLLSTKYLHINETELGDRREALAVSNKLKPLAAAPPETLRINQKGIKRIKIRNVVNATMTTNSQMPLRLNGTSRRFYGLWSDLQTRDELDNMTPEWVAYWEDRWTWMRTGGFQACIWYLRNCVDLRDFNPGAAPPMTQFMRDIKEASKSHLQLLIESMISKRLGIFKADVVRMEDVIDTLKASAMLANNDVSVDPRFIVAPKVAQTMSTINSCRNLPGSYKGETVKLWVIRDKERYISMGAADLYREYERQLMQAKQATNLTVVR